MLLRYVCFAAALVLASAVPGVPTAEIVSGVSATVEPSFVAGLAIFLTAWVASWVGDAVLLTEARLASRRLGPRLERRLSGRRVGALVGRLSRNPVTATATARLIPGLRAVTLVTFGLTRTSRRQVLLGDAIGCAAWAALYTSVGLIGGSVTGHPVWAVVVAAVLALVVSQGIRLVFAPRGRRSEAGGGSDECLRS